MSRNAWTQMEREYIRDLELSEIAAEEREYMRRLPADVITKETEEDLSMYNTWATLA